MPSVTVTSLRLFAIGAAAGSSAYWFDRLTRGPARRSADILTQHYAPPGAGPTLGKYDVAVIGGGIVGASVARELRRQFPNKSVVLIEKEATVACHQSSHNSGVVHAGIYDGELSLKTTLCIRGNRLMYDYCKQHHLPVRNAQKLVVATTDAEVEVLRRVFEQAKKNGAEGVRLLGPDEITELEPNVRGLQAIHCPSTGIVDFAEVTRSVLRELQASPKFTFVPKLQVEAIGTRSDDGRVAILGREPGQLGPVKVIEAAKLITCAGLHMDTVSRMAGGAHSPTIVPFRGRFWELRGEAKKLVRMNVYPTPRQGGIPVGVHFTPTVNVERGEQMIIGPGAALAPHKEGYRIDNISLRDLADIAFSLNNWTFLVKNVGTIFDAVYQDVSKAAFVADAQRLVPSLKTEDVVVSYSGVMAQAFGGDGRPLKDFAFEAARAPEFHPHGTGSAGPRVNREKNVFNLRHCPSPGATSAFALAETIVSLAHQPETSDCRHRAGHDVPARAAA